MTGRRPGPFAVVGVSLGALAAGTFATVGIGALAPELQADLGFSRSGIGLLTGLVFVGASIASPRAGTLTDTYGPERVLAVSLALFAAAVAIAAVAPSAWLFMVAMAVGGLSYGGINPPTNVVVAGRIARRLGFFMSLKQTGVPIGGFLAGLVLPPVALALSWRYAFGLAALVGLAVAASTVLLRGVPVAGPATGASLPPAVRRHWIVIGGYGFVMAGVQWVFLTYFVLYLTDARGWTLQTAGLALAVATGCSVAGRLFWGWLSDRPGWRVPVLVLAAAIGAVALALLAVDVPGAVVWPVAAVTGAALFGWNGAYHAVVADRAGPSGVARASGRVMAFVFAGSVALPPLLGFASESLDSWRPLWGAGATIVALAGGALWLAFRKQAQPAAVSLQTGETAGVD